MHIIPNPLSEHRPHISKIFVRFLLCHTVPVVKFPTEMFAARTCNLFAAVPRTAATAARSRRPFHSSASLSVRVGDSIPDLEVLSENSPGNKINLARELRGTKKALLIGVPAAFSKDFKADLQQNTLES